MKDSTRRLVVLLAALLTVALTARLGLWQLSRAAQKEALQASLEQRSALPPLAGDELAQDEAGAATQRYRHVTLSGRWQPQHSVFLDNRQMDGRVGFYLLTPLQLDGGGAVIVQRGWAPRDLRDRALLPEVPTPVGRVRIEGIVAPPPSPLYDFGGVEGGRLRQNIELGAYGREIGLALRPLSVQQTADASPDGLRRHWSLPAVDVSKHYGYAFQWFAMATLTTGLYVWFQLLQPWLRRRRARG